MGATLAAGVIPDEGMLLVRAVAIESCVGERGGVVAETSLFITPGRWAPIVFRQQHHHNMEALAINKATTRPCNAWEMLYPRAELEVAGWLSQKISLLSSISCLADTSAIPCRRRMQAPGSAAALVAAHTARSESESGGISATVCTRPSRACGLTARMGACPCEVSEAAAASLMR